LSCLAVSLKMLLSESVSSMLSLQLVLVDSIAQSGGEFNLFRHGSNELDTFLLT